MSKRSLRNSEQETTKDQERDEFKIELKKIGTLEENTEQQPYDMFCCSAPDGF
jgi:hypothetical protein